VAKTAGVAARKRGRNDCMRILSVSDKIEPVLYGPYIKQRVGQVDLILACGDLPYYYLEFIVGLLDAPLFFVHGNHDAAVERSGTKNPNEHGTALEWAANLHRRTVSYKGMLLAGLEGCRVYNPGMPYQYNESEVGRQAFSLSWLLRYNRLRYGRYLDILVTHAPPYSIHDGRDVAHTGFYTYLAMLRRYRPALMVHGHYHIYNRSAEEAMDYDYDGVTIVNTYGYRIIELAQRAAGGWDVLSTSL
jgi:uncharacterized protein